MSEEQVTWSDVLDLVTRLDESGLADAEVTLPGVRVRVSRTALPTTAPEATAATAPAPAPAPVAVTTPAAVADDPAPSDGLVEITAPMLGVVYLRPSPEAPPFVQVGDTVEPDTTVAIVEVMKLMNNVPAGVSGRVVDVVATEGEMAEHGAVLYRVDPA